MEWVARAGAVGVLVVLPQVIGFGASRIGRRPRARVWPLAAAGAVAVLWALCAIGHHRAAEQGRTECGSPQDALNFFAAVLLAAHLVVGGILGTLDRRARRS
ncbi:MAG TPA: hypothetical protein VKZ18_08970 [Polyangia bacterium]|nr:hypothetical protein [Polyangia bacterium]